MISPAKVFFATAIDFANTKEIRSPTPSNYASFIETEGILYCGFDFASELRAIFLTISKLATVRKDMSAAGTDTEETKVLFAENPRKLAEIFPKDFRVGSGVAEITAYDFPAKTTDFITPTLESSQNLMKLTIPLTRTITSTIPDPKIPFAFDFFSANAIIGDFALAKICSTITNFPVSTRLVVIVAYATPIPHSAKPPTLW